MGDRAITTFAIPMAPLIAPRLWNQPQSRDPIGFSAFHDSSEINYSIRLSKSSAHLAGYNLPVTHHL